MLYKFLYALYNTQVNTKKHYEGDSMYPQLACRELGLGANPMTRKIQKITPEWQSEPFFCSVGSAVARVKGKHHDGDAAKLGGLLCRQFRWYRELFRPVGMKGFFYLQKSEECKSKINFQISRLIRKFIMTYLRSKSTENPKDLRYIRALRYIPAFSAVSPIFISTVKQRQKPHHHKPYGR